MDNKFDVIVIGAGILGTSIAANMSEAGYSTLLIERGDVASGASGANLGQISISDRVEPWHMPLALESQKYYREVLTKDYDIEYNHSGGSLFLMNDEQIELAKKVQADMKAYGVESEIYYGEDVNKIQPSVKADAMKALLHVPEEGKLNPFFTVLAFLDKALKAGTVLLKNTEVVSFTKEGTHVTAVNTKDASYSAKWIVNATGPRAAFLGELAGVKIPVNFHKGTAFVSEPVQEYLIGPIVGGGALMEGTPGPRPQRHVGTGLIQTADGTIVIAQSTEECESDDRSVNMPSLALVAKRFLTFYPQLRDIQIVRAWAAGTTYTQDNIPVFGFSKDADNFFTVAGWKGAFSTAPAVARITREALEGNMDPMYESASPDRVMPY